MSRHDWYRQSEWSDVQAAAFFQRLGRSRTAFHRAQYLRIQALTLAGTGQRDKLKVALELLERIFQEYPDEFDVPLAYLEAGRCYDELGNIEAATHYFERAFAEQTRQRNLDTGVAHEYPWFIVRRGLIDLYGRALEVLSNAEPVFPYQRFQVSASRALIAAHRRELAAARASARAALDAASLRRSPFARHPDVGLVDRERYHEWLERLEALAST
jgi:tetratricopeptide (TPR) repeat protein